MVRGQTAYFLFCAEKREEAKALVEAAGQPGAKVSVTAVAKQLGVLWKALSDDAKQRYKDLAKEKAEALPAQREVTAAAEESDDQHAAQADAPVAGAGSEGRDEDGRAPRGDGALGGAEEEASLAADCDGAAAGGGKAAAPQHFPVSNVRKIMCLDDDVQRVSTGAVRAVGWAAEMFIQNLAVKALQLARKAKRKTLRFSDIEQVVRSDRRCIDMCLKEVLCTEATFAQARGELPDNHNSEEAAAGKENEGTETEREPKKVSKGKAPPKDLAGVRQISTFFKT